MIPLTVRADGKKWLPTIEAAKQRYPHGTRGRYCFGKCRCTRCRSAIREYERERLARRQPPYGVRHLRASGTWKIYCRADRAVVFVSNDQDTVQRRLARLNAGHRPDPNELVSADPARAHIAWLQSQGLGVKWIGKAIPMATSVLNRIITGDVARTRRGNLERILAVGPDLVRDGARVRADESLILIDRLVAASYRRGWIALQLGAKRAALQIGKSEYITIRHARAIHALYKRLQADDSRLPPALFRLGIVESTYVRSGRAGRTVGRTRVYAHGSVARYSTGCRCKNCAAANAAVATARRNAGHARYLVRGHGTGWNVVERTGNSIAFTSAKRAICVEMATALNASDPIAGPSTLVDAAPARAHLFALRAAGLTNVDIAAAGGLLTSLVWHLASGRSKRIQRRTADAIFSVDANAIEPSGLVDAAPTNALITRLQDAGFRTAWLAKVLERPPHALKPRRRLRLGEARAIHTLYADLRDRLPTLRALEPEKAA